MLADFAYFSGVGAGTTLGMGQTIRIEGINKNDMVFYKNDMRIYPSNRNSKTLFISYSSQDKETVDKLAELLQKAGFGIWLDQKDIVIGQSILDRVRDGVTKESDYVLIILSRNSTASEWCKLELRMAYQKELEMKKIVVLPVRIDDADVPEEVRTKKYHQLIVNDEKSVSSLIHQIMSLK